MKQTIKLSESQLKNIIKESVSEVLSEAGFGAAMRGIYRNAKNSDEPIYNGEKVTDLIKATAGYINGDSDNNKHPERYKQTKSDYLQHKKDFDKSQIKNPNDYSGHGGYENYTNMEYEKDFIDSEGITALEQMPGIKGKISRAAAVGGAPFAHVAGKIARNFDTKLKNHIKQK